MRAGFEIDENHFGIIQAIDGKAGGILTVACEQKMGSQEHPAEYRTCSISRPMLLGPHTGGKDVMARFEGLVQR